MALQKKTEKLVKRKIELAEFNGILKIAQSRLKEVKSLNLVSFFHDCYDQMMRAFPIFGNRLKRRNSKWQMETYY